MFSYVLSKFLCLEVLRNWAQLSFWSNITPKVDICHLLLIFMLISSPFFRIKLIFTLFSTNQKFYFDFYI